nr:unnamed protein product [Callosobruchus chinensis]
MIWHEHVSSIATAAGKKLGYLFRAREYFSPPNLRTLYKAHIRPSLEYCSHIWGLMPPLPCLYLMQSQSREGQFYSSREFQVMAFSGNDHPCAMDASKTQISLSGGEAYANRWIRGHRMERRDDGSRKTTDGALGKCSRGRDQHSIDVPQLFPPPYGNIAVYKYDEVLG